jgi:hypothetical protein
VRTPTLEEFRRDPELRAELVRAAHRQRNEEMGRWFARLFEALKPRAAHRLALRRR